MIYITKQRKAFTLVEILIVICIISILFVVLVSKVDFATDKSKNVGVHYDFHAMQSALHIVALENDGFSDDITQLAAAINRNLDSELSVRIEDGVMKTNAKDPWGSSYVLEYDQPDNTKGRVTLLSPGPDTILKTKDDIVSEVVVQFENGKTNIVINNEIIFEDSDHTCIHDRRVQNEKFLATKGNCITPNVYYFSCKCGSKTSETFWGDYNMDTHIGEQNITYLSNGENHKTFTHCSSCNTLISETTDEHYMIDEKCEFCEQVIHNHNYTLEIVSENTLATHASCEQPATYYYSCTGTECNSLGNETFSYGEKLEHNFTNDSLEYKATSATCLVPATYWQTCSNCGEKGTETFASGINDGPHSTTTRSGYIKISEEQHKKQTLCNDCGYELSFILEEHVLDSNDKCTNCKQHIHNYIVEDFDNDKHLAVPASCMEPAKYYYSCSCDLNGTNTFEYGTPLSHNSSGMIESERYFKSQATCLVPTTYFKSCTGCGLESTETFTVGEALGHIENKTTGYNATCTENGLSDGVICSRCNEIVVMQMVIPATGHTEQVISGHAATCITDGQTDKILCSTCQTTLVPHETIQAIGHSIVYSEGYAPTCTNVGFTTGEACSLCDYKITQQEIPMVPHNEVVDNAVPATCIEIGYTAGKHCSVCNTVTEPQISIPALGHTESILSSTEATCTKSGVSEGKICSTCNTILVAQQNIPATGHIEIIDNAVAATCTSEGRTAGSHCSKCNTIISGGSIIAKLDHNYSVEVIIPTCTETGAIVYTCNCGDTTQVTLVASGHIDLDNNNQCDICNDNLNVNIKTFALYEGDNPKYPTIYYYNDGMTWEEWINSEYNIDNFTIDGENIKTGILPSPWATSIVPVCKDWKIFDNVVYVNDYVLSAEPYIEGLWLFNKDLNGYLDQININFVYNNQAYTSMYQATSSLFFDNDNVYDDGLATNPTYMTYAIERPGPKWYYNTRVVDFGSTPQLVSPEFYDWLTENANPACELNGQWTFNEQLVDDIEIDEITFVYDSQTYSSISFTSNDMYFDDLFVYHYGLSVNPSGITTYVERPGSPQWLYNNKLIDFGNTTQYVTKQFYNWLTQNATMQKQYTLSGTCVFNKQLIGDQVYQNINFTFGDKQYSTIHMDLHLIFDMTDYVYSPGGGTNPTSLTWSIPEGPTWLYGTRVICFGSEEQSVSQEFYEWFMANATPACELDGKWTFNNTLTFPLADMLEYVTYINDEEYYDMFVTSNSVYFYDIVYNTEFGGWVQQAFRTIEFVNTQYVSQEFYEWFIANATQSIEKTYTLSGIWTFNDKIILTEDLISQTINFTYEGMSNTDVLVGMFCEDDDGVLIHYLFIDKSFNDQYTNSSEVYWKMWHNANYKTLNFGDTPQVVSKEFYEWFVINATPMNNNVSCGHEVIETILVNPTCAQAGLKLVICPTCQTTTYIALESIPHQVITIPGTPATCTSAGATAAQQCSVCSKYLVYSTTLQALGHDFKTVSLNESTCITSGLVVEQCNRCNIVEERIIAKTGHIDASPENGICDICNTVIEYTMYIANQEYTFTYNMTWGEWYQSKYNNTNLVQVGDAFIIINDDGKTGHKLTHVYGEKVGNENKVYVTLIKASDLIRSDKYTLPTITFNGTTVVTNDGIFTSEFSELGIETYMDMANKLKDGSLYAVIDNGNVYYTYEDAVIDVTLYAYVNNYLFKTYSTSICLIHNTNTSIRFDFGTDGKWYYADNNGNPTGNIISTGNSCSVTESVNLVYMSTYAPELSFRDVGVDEALDYATIELYNVITGQLINTFTTDKNGKVKITGLIPGEYECKSTYQTYKISVTEDGFNAQLQSDSNIFAASFNIASSGKVHLYDMSGNLLNSVNISNGQVKLYLVPGEYKIQVNNQAQMQIITINENGKITLSTL